MRILSFDLGDFNAPSAWRYEDDCHTTIKTGTVTTAAGPLADLLGTLRPQIVLCEACSMTPLLQDVTLATLEGCQFLAANTNADAWRWTNTKTKTDAKDCERLIRLYRVNELSTVYIPNQHGRAFRRQIMHRGKLVERRAAAYNGIRAACKRHQVPLAKGEAAWSEKGLAHLDALVAPVLNRTTALTLADASVWLIEVAHLLAQIRLLNAQLAQVEALIERELTSRPQARLLKSVPGIGPQIAAVILAFVADPHRFKNGKCLASYAGLVPRVYQSGKTERMGSITKAGNVRLRKLLINAAWMAVRFNPWAKAVFERVTGGSRNRSRRKIAIVAVARRMLIRAWAMLRDNTTWNATIGVTAA